MNRISEGLFLWGQAFLFITLLLLLAQAPVSSADSGTATPPVGTPVPTPTIDRLLAPPTVENPTQADEGAQLYWLYCQPCHGDQGQGLTDDWRAQYPPEDQYCWGRGCHAEIPYENGFTLPTVVPALIGEGSLERFQTMGQVYTYMRGTMPFNQPASMEDAEYLAITAFLARAHDAWEGTPLQPDTVNEVWVRGVPADLPPEVHEAPPVPGDDTETAAEPTSPVVSPTRTSWWYFLLGVPVLIGVLWLWIQRSRRA